MIKIKILKLNHKLRNQGGFTIINKDLQFLKIYFY